MSKRLRSNLITYGIVIVAFVVLQSLIATKSLSNALQGQLIRICAYV